VSIAYFRNGERHSASTRIEDLDLELDATGGAEPKAAAGFGLSLGDITSDVASALRLPADVTGAIVENVQPFAPASAAGLRRGDVVLEVNHQPVRSAGEAARQLRSIRPGETGFLLLWRNGVRQFVELRKE
jgi:serine protease Do